MLRTPARVAFALVLFASTAHAVPAAPPPAPSYVSESYVSEMARTQYAQERGFTFNKIIRGDTRRPLIALTFDDGPHPAMTVKLLNILRRAHVPATFIVVGRQVERIPPVLVAYELDACNAAIVKATGAPARFFRPPGGDYDGAILRDAAARGYITMLWTDDPGDFMKPGGAAMSS